MHKQTVQAQIRLLMVCTVYKSARHHQLIAHCATVKSNYSNFKLITVTGYHVLVFTRKTQKRIEETVTHLHINSSPA